MVHKKLTLGFVITITLCAGFAARESFRNHDSLWTVFCLVVFTWNVSTLVKYFRGAK